ncbi:transcriptional regulator, GntR family [Chthonomonas calidirosea]|uniref:Transcriptional regulator, GntR family n=1 Tax=Chthonomonas calidirosea (strain DSM 23976 / ICMP 18418 / T49) TaxID=1303518 RepID=S0ESS1_CHTCT|nr:GntR family transcriptional regulator [Chthonomonas calidirosea]CCW34319.1 transcriptional regulator, GntR family [Chthonomonas calidirosea T49]CEK15117.1 transcriptional regulator, GntR family [Chthonomonas calidirosea]
MSSQLLKPMTVELGAVRVVRDGPLPRHLQVKQILRDLVHRGVWKAGDKIPAETEIASSLGVSKMTVNKAILALVEEGLFYREVGRGTFVKDTSASGVRTHRKRVSDWPRRQTSTIYHVITVGPTEMVADNEYLCALLLAMRCQVSPLEVTLMLQQVRGQDYVRFWRADHSAGWIIVAPRQEDVEGLYALAAEGARAVVVGASWQGVPLPCVDSNNREGAEMAVDYLFRLGHRKLGLVYAEPNAINTQDRILGFQAALQAKVLPFRPDWMIDAGTPEGIAESARSRLRELLSAPERPTAFLAAGPFLARTLLELAQEEGISVPEQLSIVGFDDPTAMAQAVPKLTTVKQPLEAMGREAIKKLQEMHAKGMIKLTEPDRVFLSCSLVTRESTAPPPP